MLLLFKQGEKGLAAIRPDGMFCFPSKGSKITAEGIYDCNVVKEMKSYCFVSGEKVTVPKITDCKEALQHIILQKQRNKEITLGDIKTIHGVVCGDELFAILTENGYCSIGYFVGYEFNTVVVYFDRIAARSKGNSLANFYRINNFKKTEGFYDLYCRLELDCLDKIEDIHKITVAAICKTNLYEVMSRIESIKIYGEKIIDIEIDGRYTENNIHAVYGYDSHDNRLICLNHIDREMYSGFDCVTVPVADIKKWACDNFITWETLRSWGDRIVAIPVSFQGSDLIVYAVNGNNLLENLENLADEEKAMVQKSKEELAAFRKMVGKNLSAKNATSIIELSDMSVLGYR